MISDTARKADSEPTELRKDPEIGSGEAGKSPKRADPVPPQESALYRVCWSSVFTAACGAGDPMPRDLAEFRAENEAADHPFRRYWLEACRCGQTGVPTVRH